MTANQNTAAFNKLTIQKQKDKRAKALGPLMAPYTKLHLNSHNNSAQGAVDVFIIILYEILVVVHFLLLTVTIIIIIYLLS